METHSSSRFEKTFATSTKRARASDCDSAEGMQFRTRMRTVGVHDDDSSEPERSNSLRDVVYYLQKIEARLEAIDRRIGNIEDFIVSNNNRKQLPTVSVKDTDNEEKKESENKAPSVDEETNHGTKEEENDYEEQQEQLRYMDIPQDSEFGDYVELQADVILEVDEEDIPIFEEQSELTADEEDCEHKIEHSEPELASKSPFDDTCNNTVSDYEDYVDLTETYLIDSDQENTLCEEKEQFELPCKTVEHLQNLEETINSSKPTYAGFVNFLRSLSDNDHGKFLRHCLNAIFDRNLAVLYNWSGKGERNKKPVSHLSVMKAVQAASKTLFDEKTNKTTVKIIMRWFRYAEQRLSGRIRPGEDYLFD